ncbi:MAG: 3-keto-5-aminohexanoate cleavage protein [Peptococcaceae bacterium]|jgi:3-keto-5-aminohexanoate cleavage enzyme|nr:3-keto-5-aminohexanoate cleavage protein [Peptococcaceae bacterium]MDH7524158.1 3-keto-5-aminohexanoate cleavage protein [Peptococcaceae bacterium]
MEELKNYLLENYKETYDYSNLVWRGGLSELPPAIITCAITGSNAGKEVNPNLPELLEEQVEQTYEAYKAGASMVHIHRRDPRNPCEMTNDPEMYREVNKKIREKCPDIIINNTAVCGRKRTSDTTLSEMMLTSIYAEPEVASIDTSNYCSIQRLPKRLPPLFGRDEDVIRESCYSISDSEVKKAIGLMTERNIKPEFECFQISDIHYVNRLMKSGYRDLFGGPHLVQYVFTPGSGWPTAEYMTMVVKAVPRGCILSIVATGAQQFPVLTQALCMGLHVRVGMEDNVYIERGRLADSNAQLVEKIVRIAKEIGRKIATPAQARYMMGLPQTPKKWD